MKKDCSKAEVFLMEHARACRMAEYVGCKGCPLGDNDTLCTLPRNMVSEKAIKRSIDILQKWSDEHPVITMLEKFDEMFPKADKYDNGVPKMCPSALGWEYNMRACRSIECDTCWSREYKEGDTK